MGKINNNPKNADELTRLLRRISKGEDPAVLRKEATRLINDVRPQDIAAAEQNLIESGFPAQLVQQLSSAFMLMGILEEHSVSVRSKLPYSHILRKVMSEHELARCYLADLEAVVKEIEVQEKITDVSSEFRRLTHIIEHLNAMDEHIDREEDIIFPFLQKHGWATLCRSAHDDHVYIKVAVDDLIKLVSGFKQQDCREFKVRLNSISRYLIKRMLEHLFQEDNILYPIALEIINDKNVWEKMRGVCDDIGYCGVHV